MTEPGKSREDPMCINMYCPSAFVCRRFIAEPYQGGPATIFIDPVPDQLGGKLCEDFDPAENNPAKIQQSQPSRYDGEKTHKA